MAVPSNAELAQLLRQHGVNPTSQRLAVAHVLFSRGMHLSAEDTFNLVNAGGKHVSKATVYNTLGLLAQKGIVREVIADPTRVFYDPNTKPHHHFYDVTTGSLKDIDADQVRVTGLPSLPEGTALEGVEVIVRLRSTR